MIMGMFDTVKYECYCPVCGNKVTDFQSKDGDCVNDTLSPSVVDNFYSGCSDCGCSLEFQAVKKNTEFTLTVFNGFSKNQEHPVQVVTIPIEEE